MKNNIIRCGLGTLSGVQRIDVVSGCWDEVVNGYIFVINGITYKIHENPDDGYRSYTEISVVTDKETICNNTFPPQSVFITSENYNKYWGENDEMYTIYNMDGEVILRFGTDRTDSYYPMAIFEFHPQNMPINMES